MDTDKKKYRDNFKEDYVEVNGIRLHYVSVGEGKLIIFLHGFPDFWAEWENQLIEFGKDHQATAIDLPGYNLSSKPAELARYGIGNIVEDVNALVRHLGHKRFILVGHNWGGVVAWFFAIKHPDLLDKLIIINSPHPAIFAREMLNNAAQRNASQYMLLFRNPAAEKILSDNNYAFLLQLLSEGENSWKMSDMERKRYIKAWSRPGALTGGLNYYRASPVYPPSSAKEENSLREITKLPHDIFAVKVPTLLIWGEQDIVFSKENLTGLDEYVQDLTIVRIPDGSHWVIKQQPERVNSLIREFIESRNNKA